ncbi:tyrosine-protein phosphatase Lar-like isoform X5 [Haliotis rufescens]|uniref:tyrosine-protein phosphatase Lar-like isoform X5 n=1 Tax=Haliotis rufescens TaxID=6454 RepID=UPI001EAFEC5C|nr:tyrosine-protein phosphatase Lar-like isoform X5 [Haliotis rufescens]
MRMYVCFLAVLVSALVRRAHTSGNMTYQFRYIEFVQSPPRITLAPKSQLVAEEAKVSFFCKASGNPAPSFHWEKGNKRINPRRNRYLITEVPHLSVLRIDPVKSKRDDATFTCVANNGQGEARANATLRVYMKVGDVDDFPGGYPRIAVNPSLKSVEKGHNAIMQCESAGTPEPAILWLKDHVPVDMTDPRITLLDSGYLQIQNSQESDAGRYECVAENDVGVAYSYAAMLYVKGGLVVLSEIRRVPPHFSIPPEDIKVMPGSDVNLTCVAVGSPMPFVKWREGARELTDEDDLPIGRNILQLKDVRKSKNYTCIASSDLGNIEAMAQVVVEALPNPPAGLEASDVTATSLKLSWDVFASSGDLSYIVQYKPVNKRGADYKEKTGIVNPVYTVGHLMAFTRYEFRVIAVTNIGRGSPSDTIEVTTGELAPGSPPRNVRARAASSTTIVVSWNEPEIPNGIIQGYKVFYTLLPQKPIFFWDVQEVTNDNKLTTISGLEPNKTYTLSALAFSGIGQGPMSHPIQVLTTQGAPIFDAGLPVPYQPLNLHADPISANEIDVVWDPPQEADSIDSYELYYNDSHFRQNVRLSINPPVAKFRLTDLTPDTVYHIQVSAKSKRGEGPKTPTIQAKTKQFIPEAPPKAVSGRILDAHRITVSWDPPSADKQNGDLAGYKIYYVEIADAKNDSDAMVAKVNGDTKSYTLKDLKTATKYKIWVVSHTAVGDGPPSQPIIVETEEDVPGEPRKVRVEAINSTAIYVEWREPIERHGIIRGYQVYFYEVDSNDETIPGKQARFHDTFDGTKHEAVITGLEPDTRYNIRVAAYTRKGDGIRSKARVITTKGAVPSPPRNLHVDLIQEDPPRVKVTWQRPRVTHGPVENYKIIWGRIGERYEEKILPAEKYSFVTYSLDKGTTYEFRVSAKNDVDYGERAVENIKTPDGAPAGAPQNFTATGISETSVHLTWDLPARALRNGDIVMYQITYHKLSDPINEEDLNVTDTYVDITGLEMNTDYRFKIKAYTSKGSGPWSNNLHFRTFGHMPPAPKNVKIRRTSSSIIEVTWDEPDFPVAGYKIYYNMFATPDMEVWQTLETGPYTVAEITGLETHTVYAVRIQARSVDDRYGNLSDMVTTDFIPPFRQDVVQNFRVTLRTPHMVKLSWDKPVKPNVNSYQLRYEGVKNYWENGVIKQIYQAREEVRIPGQMTTWSLPNLQPKMKFDFNISAIFQHGNAGPDQHIIVETLIEAPPSVHRPEVVKVSHGKITLRLSRASERNGPISYYHLIVVPQKQHQHNIHKLPQDFTLEMLSKETESVENPASYPYIAARFDSRSLPPDFHLGNGQEYGAFFNRRLDEDDQYKVFLRAYSVDPRLYTSSEYSEILSLSTGISETPIVRPANPKTVDNPKPSQDDVTAHDETNRLLLIVAPACGGGVFLILVCAVIAFLMFRKKSNSKGAILEPESKVMVDIPPYLVDPVEMRRQHYQTPAMISHPPIPIERLGDHIENLKANDNLKFSQEYESIEPGQQFTWDNSNLEVNKPKNRYANVIAYDHSRVILQPIDGVPGSDYINANYMDGYRKQNAYIATQGPLPETFGDFWRMVWEQRSTTIVMMTKLEERSRIKCDQYWPSRGAETYGIMHIHLVDVTELATYTVRTFQIARYGCPEKREVRQFQFTAWPDHGVPDHPTPLLMFMRRVKSSNPADAGPMVVHCSAGVGRTGAFIVIDAMLERIKHEKTVDIYGHVTCLRAQRNYMVQTEDQYIFIHDSLLEAVQCGNTEVPARNLTAHIQKLTAPEPGETVTGMELEFKRLANVKASPNRFVSANLPVNKFKNRLVNILPYESTRVCLQPIRGVDGSDYINASFIDGYRYKKAYIATQGPLAETTEDFWRMLWEHNSTIIVMLTKLREMGREKCHQYWPSERSARYQYFVVDPMTEYNMPQYILREFKVTDARDGQSRTIRQFQFTDWPEQGVPKSGEGFIDFIGQVHKTKEQFGQEGPITVHCSAGVGRTGVFITLSIVLERMRYEGVVDMFQTVKMLRTQRPAMVQTEDQYQFNYRAALEYLGSFDHYAN